MAMLKVILDGDGCWPDLPGKEVIHLGNLSMPIQIATLPGGLSSGKTSVSIRIDLPDGKVVIAETTLALFLSAAETFKVHYEGPQYGRWDDEN